MKIFNAIKGSLCEMAFFACMFAAIGYFVPEIYFRYFDRTQYYLIQNPIVVENTLIRPCDKVTVEINRKSLISTNALSVRELVLIKDSIEVARFTTDIAINLNDTIVHAQWLIPCDVTPGTYMFRGVVSYKFRGQEKTTEFYSTNFEVLDRLPIK